MEQGPTFRVTLPRFASGDPNYRILARQRSRFTHYYFYIRDEGLGPMAVRAASFLPFQATYYLNGHSFIEKELTRAGTLSQARQRFPCRLRPAALQAAADRFSPEIIRRRLDYWTFILGPKFSKTERAGSTWPPLRYLAGRILPQLRLQAPLPHPPAVRARLRNRPVADRRRQDRRGLRQRLPRKIGGS